MLVVELNRANFEYDVNSIVRAFYPEEQVHVITPEMSEEKKAGLRDAVRFKVELREDGAGVTGRGWRRSCSEDPDL